MSRTPAEILNEANFYFKSQMWMVALSRYEQLLSSDIQIDIKMVHCLQAIISIVGGAIVKSCVWINSSSGNPVTNHFQTI